MDTGLDYASGASPVLGHSDDLERILVDQKLVAERPALSPVVDPQAHLEGLLAEDTDGAYRNAVVVDQPPHLFVRWQSAAMARDDDNLDPIVDKGLLVLGSRAPTPLRHSSPYRPMAWPMRILIATSRTPLAIVPPQFCGH